MKNVILVTLLALSPMAMAQDPDGCADALPVDGRPFDMDLDAHGNLHVAGRAGVYTSCDNGNEWTATNSARVPALSIHASSTDPDLILYGASPGVYISRDRGFSFESRGSAISGSVFAVTTGPDGRYYAGTSSGVYVSENQGDNWSLLPGSPSGYTIQSLLVDPLNENVIYAANDGDGVFRSTDRGVTWSELSNLQWVWQVHELVFGPDNSGVLLAASADGIWRTADGGDNWDQQSAIGQIRDIVFDPQDSLKAYAVSREGGVLRSFDGGTTWQLASDNWPYDLSKLYSVAVANDGTVLVGLEFDGVYKSSDQGTTWTRSGQEPSPEPPPAPPPVSSGAVSMTMDIEYLGGEDSIPAGQNGRFRITIKNNGPDRATDTQVQLSWFRTPVVGSRTGYDFTVSSSQGSCTRSLTPEPDCRLGTIPSGGTVTIQLSGSTEPKKLGWYTLRANVQAIEGGISDEYSIGTSVTVLDSEGGGGGAVSSWLLLALCSVGVLARRLRSTSTTSR